MLMRYNIIGYFCDFILGKRVKVIFCFLFALKIDYYPYKVSLGLLRIEMIHNVEHQNNGLYFKESLKSEIDVIGKLN